MRFKTYLLLLFPFCITIRAVAYNEEKTDSLGNVVTIYSLHQQHSTFHYDLVKLLAIEAGYPADSAELIARYSALVDQSNPQPGYPYPEDLTGGLPLPDTFPDWTQSIAGTERTAPGLNSFGENPGCYWHFSLRNPADTNTGALVYASDYPKKVPAGYRGAPNFWRVPFSYYLDSIWNWAILGTGVAGNPNGAPKPVFYFDGTGNQYQLVPPGSIVSLGILVHSIGDSYSHEECEVTDTIRSHPTSPVLCNANYHHLEMPYDYPTYSYAHIDKSAQAIWRALIAYAAAKGYNYAPLWTSSTGSDIPDQLIDTGDSLHTATFIERWKSPATTDLTGDGIIDHSDHTALRIGLASAEIATGLNANSFIPVVTMQVFPNPAAGQLNVFVYGISEKTTVSLFDITGRMLEEKEVSATEGHIQMDVSRLANDIYFVSANTMLQKVIVSNN